MQENQSLRLFVIKILLVLVFSVYAVRLFSMQIVSGDVYRTRAQEFSRRTYKIPTQRGEIFDRNFDAPMVINRDSFGVSITPAEVPRNRMDEILESLSKII